MQDTEKKILNLLEEDARLSEEQIAVMCDTTPEVVRATIAENEANGVIVGYHSLIDWDKTDREYVSAIIELKITPQSGRGFDRVAERIYNFPEVKSLYLVSGSFDLAVIIEGRTMKEVAYFVARHLATLDDVTATSTHFLLRKYKSNGVVYGPAVIDERGNCL